MITGTHLCTQGGGSARCCIAANVAAAALFTAAISYIGAGAVFSALMGGTINVSSLSNKFPNPC